MGDEWPLAAAVVSHTVGDEGPLADDCEYPRGGESAPDTALGAIQGPLAGVRSEPSAPEENWTGQLEGWLLARSAAHRRAACADWWARRLSDLTRQEVRQDKRTFLQSSLDQAAAASEEGNLKAVYSLRVGEDPCRGYRAAQVGVRRNVQGVPHDDGAAGHGQRAARGDQGSVPGVAPPLG